MNVVTMMMGVVGLGIERVVRRGGGQNRIWACMHAFARGARPGPLSCFGSRPAGRWEWDGRQFIDRPGSVALEDRCMHAPRCTGASVDEKAQTLTSDILYGSTLTIIFLMIQILVRLVYKRYDASVDPYLPCLFVGHSMYSITQNILQEKLLVKVYMLIF